MTAIFFTGCATSARSNRITFHVTSDPTGCPVEVNGMNMGTTPTDIQLGASKRWVGILNSPDGWEFGRETYQVTCFPPPDAREQLTSQSKSVSPGMMPEGGNLYFNLRLTPVTPKQSVEIKSDIRKDVVIQDKTTTPSTETNTDSAERLRKLKKLKDDQLITEQEYEQKRQAILKEL